MGTRANPLCDQIAVDGKPIVLSDVVHALILNKPPGVLTTRDDDHGRPTVMDLVTPDLRTLVYPVGRLDLESAGLVLLTNDGDLAFRITHPSFHVSKTYRVETDRPANASEIMALRSGVDIKGGPTRPAKVSTSAHDPHQLTITLYEGRKRQIRRMLGALGMDTRSLHRIGVGPVRLGDLPSRHVRSLTDQELTALRRAAGLDQ